VTNHLQHGVGPASVCRLEKCRAELFERKRDGAVFLGETETGGLEIGREDFGEESQRGGDGA
jgi:hypothetical protein